MAVLSFGSPAENNVSSGKISRFSTHEIDAPRCISLLLLELHSYRVKMRRREGMKKSDGPISREIASWFLI